MPHPKHDGRRVLVVAGSTEVRAALAQSLASAGCVVELAETAARVRQLATAGQIALAMLSPEGLPSEGGAEVARVLAARVGKLVLIRPLHAESPTRSFEADGIVRDPFDRSEVLEQITHLLPRLPGSGDDDGTAGSVLRFDDLSLDLSGHTLLGRDGVEIRLTRNELALLTVLARRPGQTISRDDLRNAVAGRDLEPYERSIDVLVARLRRKIERDHKHPSLILTVPGLGYKLGSKPEVMRRSLEASPLQRDASLVSETGTAWAPAGKFVSGVRARRYIALVLSGVIGVAVLTAGLAYYNYATPRPAHWLDGSWVAILSPRPFVTNAFCNHTDPRCRNLAISGVTGDGQYRAMWGDQGGQPSTAEITLIGKTVRIQTSFNVLADVTRSDSDILSGSLQGPNGWSIPITLRRVDDLTWGTRALNHWLNGTWVAILSSEQISESDFCSHSDPRCREFFVSGIGGNGNYGGLWGRQDGQMGQADITVSGDTVEIVSATNSRIELRRNADGIVSGTLTTPEGILFLVKLRQVERASD